MPKLLLVLALGSVVAVILTATVFVWPSSHGTPPREQVAQAVVPAADEPAFAVAEAAPFPPAAEALEAMDQVWHGRETGCGAELPLWATPGKSVRQQLSSGGFDREYLVHLPAGLTTTTGFPLVLNFHGRGSNAETQESYSGLVPLSDRERFILVSPEGTGEPRAWSAGATHPTGVDDVRFVQDVLRQLTTSLCIDRSRVFATGFSNGGFLASRIGCVMGDRIAAIAPVGGLEGPQDSCLRPMPVLAFHGTKDQLVPFSRGTVRGEYPYDGPRAEAADWAKANRCSGNARVEKMTARVQRETWDGSAPVVLLVIQDGGHTWPGASDIPELGTTTREVSAAAQMWAFFVAHPLPATH